MAKREKKYDDKSLAEKKVDFKRHLRTYLVMSLFFLVLNIATGGGIWWFWPVLGWGIGVVMQGLSLYGPLKDPDHVHPKEEERLEPLPDLREERERVELEAKPYRDEDLV